MITEYLAVVDETVEILQQNCFDQALEVVGLIRHSRSAPAWFVQICPPQGCVYVPGVKAGPVWPLWSLQCVVGRHSKDSADSDTHVEPLSRSSEHHHSGPPTCFTVMHRRLRQFKVAITHLTKTYWTSSEPDHNVWRMSH